eukprot:CAMPEP_0184863220 /NCGR_PEP_ID=MMETSP0580-20130426/9804_1 /TAXON_ID=1118495 /ORGANISM="Dactyliosolen fragilissimus" /LENGTH=311 /DNA_ID=CAMNT_0027361415 /DNA_START=308 /DNA_END=1243 /DNA_ORIENTATION=-
MEGGPMQRRGRGPPPPGPQGEQFEDGPPPPEFDYRPRQPFSSGPGMNVNDNAFRYGTQGGYATQGSSMRNVGRGYGAGTSQYSSMGGDLGREGRWDSVNPSTAIQGDSLRTFNNANGEYMSDIDGRTNVVMETEGRPLDGKMEVWEGPNNTPTSVKVKSENGALYPFFATVTSPNARVGSRQSSTMSVRNTGPLEFPMAASVGHPDQYTPPEVEPMAWVKVQGESLKTWTLGYEIQAAQVTILTDGMPLMATVELWGASGWTKQVAEIYNDNGQTRPFVATIPTPGDANTICVRNKGPMAFPITVSVDGLA